MFFFLPIGFGGGGIFSFLIIFWIIRLIVRMFTGRTSSRTYYTYDSEDFFRNFNQQQQAGSTSFNKDWYAVLGLTSSATDEEIKKAYRRLILQYHPDRAEGKTQAEKEESTRRFREVQEAYENICKLRNI